MLMLLPLDTARGTGGCMCSRRWCPPSMSSPTTTKNTAPMMLHAEQQPRHPAYAVHPSGRCLRRWPGRCAVAFSTLLASSSHRVSTTWAAGAPAAVAAAAAALPAAALDAGAPSETATPPPAPSASWSCDARCRDALRCLVALPGRSLSRELADAAEGLPSSRPRCSSPSLLSSSITNAAFTNLHAQPPRRERLRVCMRWCNARVSR